MNTSVPGILLLLAVAIFGITACSSARINGMGRDAERQHIQEEGIDFCRIDVHPSA